MRFITANNLNPQKKLLDDIFFKKMVDYTNYKQIITITNTTDQTFYEHLNKQLNSYLDHFLDHDYEKPNINNINTNI